MIDSGAGAHVCPWKYGIEYPLNPLTENVKLVNANGSPIKCYGERWIKYEIIEGFFIWVKFLVCDVSNVIWSVSKLRKHDVNFNFGNELKINFGSNFSVDFYEKGDNYFFKPHRIVPFEESFTGGDRDFINDYIITEQSMLINPVTQGRTIPMQSGQADYWRVNAGTRELIRMHKRSRKGFFNPIHTQSPDCPFEIAELEDERVTHYVFDDEVEQRKDTSVEWKGRDQSKK